jgi:sRNA-binding regulator protein Hfq
MNLELLNEWKSKRSKIFVYTVGVRLRGVITKIDDLCLTLDDHTIVIFNNIISISDVESVNKQGENFGKF